MCVYFIISEILVKMSDVFFYYKELTNFPVVVFDKTDSIEYVNDLASRELEKSKISLEENKKYKIEDIPLIFNNVENCIRLKSEDKKIYVCLNSKLVENNKKFMANLSHEIRTPLNAIIGAMSLIADTELTKDQKIYIEMINEASFNLLRLVNDILDHTRLDTGRLTINKKEMSIRECISSAIKVVGFKASAKKINIKCVISHEIEDNIISDQSRLRQILVNLYYNSIKFSPENSEIITTVSLDTDGYIVFSVSDNGPGVSKEYQKELFTSFSRIHVDHDSDNQEGLGLGLSISKDLVKLLGGGIFYNSEYSGGAEFVFYIPYVFNVKEQTHDKTLITSINGKAEKSQVLLFHRDIRERINISRQITNLGIECCHVGTTEEIQILTSENDCSKFILIVEAGCVTEDLCLFIEKNAKNAVFAALVDTVEIYSIDKNNHTSPYWVSFFDNFIIKPFETSKFIKIIEDAYGISLKNTNNNGVPDNSYILKKNVSSQKEKNIYSEIKVLVDEDVYLNRVIIKKLLEKIGCINITMVENGLEAYNKMLSGEEFHICIIDIKTPKMSGIELIKKIKTMKKGSYNKNWYCIAVTANTESETFFVENRFDDFIIKPINQVILKEKIDTYLFKTGIVKSV